MADDASGPATLCRTPIQGYVLPDDVMVAHLQARLFTFICNVLGFTANGAEGKEAVIGADPGYTGNHHVGHELTVFAQLNFAADMAVRSYRARCRDFGSGLDDGCGVNPRRMGHLFLGGRWTVSR